MLERGIVKKRRRNIFGTPKDIIGDGNEKL